MATTEGRDGEAKKRIINHMNADHQDSVARYLEHHKGVSSYSASSARLTDIALDSLTIKAGSSQYRISLEPPMGSWKDARERLVQMDRDALRALDRSDITLKEYRAPKGFHAVVFALCSFAYIASTSRNNWLPGSLFYESLRLGQFPGFAKFGYAIQPLVLWGMLAIHIAEVAILIRTRLRKYNVPLFTRLWWAWVLSCFIEGFGAFQRIDAIMAEARLEKEKRAH